MAATADDRPATTRHKVLSLAMYAVIALVWLMTFYLMLSVLVTRLLPAGSMDPWPWGNVAAAMVALYAPVGVAGLLLYRYRHSSTGVQLLLHTSAAVVVLIVCLLPFGA